MYFMLSIKHAFPGISCARLVAAATNTFSRAQPAFAFLALMDARVGPRDEWHDLPDPQRKVCKVVPKQPLGKWHEISQRIAKAILSGEHSVALQLSRMHYAGADKDLMGNR